MDELPPSFQFGSYVVRQLIGRGGMARVYRAEHAALRKAVALKVMDAAWIGHVANTQRFLGEARAAAAVKHRNVVDIIDVGVWEERPYIVMELLEGLDLERHLANTGPLTEAEVVALALPIIAGMTAVHQEGIVHRDLKPSNIFLALSNEGEVTPKVLDFGISKLSEQLQEPGPRPTGTREIIGTPTYMSPEALNGVRELGPAADQYSLGVVLYQCAVGKLPFQGDTLLQLLRSIALGAFPAPRTARPQLSAALDEIISRAMRVDPRERYGTLRELGRALWPLGDERTRVIWAHYFGSGRAEPLQARALERSDHVALVRDRTRPGSRRSRRIAVSIGVCTAAALLAAIGARWLPTRASPPAAASAALSLDPAGAVAAPAQPAAPSAAQPATEVLSVQPRAQVGATGHPTVSPISEEAAAPRIQPATQRPTRAGASGHDRAREPRRAPAPHARSRATSPAVATGGPGDRPVDPDLATMFELGGARERTRSQPAAEGELRGLFPEDDAAGSRGSNGAPILD